VFTTCVYRDGVRSSDPLPFERISDVLSEPDTMVWVDIDEPTKHEMEQLGEEFGLHPLALEDAFSDHQRPKLERYENYVFIVVYAASVSDLGRVEMRECRCSWPRST
jgi:magnesium transporter